MLVPRLALDISDVRGVHFSPNESKIGRRNGAVWISIEGGRRGRSLRLAGALFVGGPSLRWPKTGTSQLVGPVLHQRSPEVLDRLLSIARLHPRTRFAGDDYVFRSWYRVAFLTLIRLALF